MLPGAEFRVGETFPATRVAEELRQVPVGIGAHHEVHAGDLLEQDGTEALRHAAHHAEHIARALEAHQLTDPSDDTLLRVVTHGARVHEHDVRLIGIRGALVALPPEDPEHEFGVRDVHLAAVGLDVDALGHERKDSAGRLRGAR